jgi:hypothetical protein
VVDETAGTHESPQVRKLFAVRPCLELRDPEVFRVRKARGREKARRKAQPFYDRIGLNILKIKRLI